MNRLAKKNGSLGSSGGSSSHRSGSGMSSSKRKSRSLSTGTESDPPDEVDLSQWSILLKDKYGRLYRERQSPDGKWEYDFQKQEQGPPGVPRINPDSSAVDVGQSPDPQAGDLDDGYSASYELSSNFETAQGPPNDISSSNFSSRTQAYPSTYQPFSFTGAQTSSSSSLDAIPERLGDLNIAPLNYDPSGVGATVGGSHVPLFHATAPYQGQSVQRGGYAYDRPERQETERADSDLQSHLSPSQSLNISTKTRELRDVLDPSFKVHNANDFRFGKVFKIYWAEPRGQGSNRPNKGTEVIEIPLNYGELCYASIRRFIIVRADKGHCLCLPILTYGKQGTTKHGVKPQDHAIVYTMDDKKGEVPPVKDPNEEDFQKSPIRIVPKSPRGKLDPLSRLNYAKIYTVEYNVKVCFIGAIHKKSEKYLKRDYNRAHALLPQNPDTTYSDEERDGGPSSNIVE